MSFGLKQKLPINDRELLVSTLKEMGQEPEQCAEPRAIRGWQREQLATKCEIVLPREQTGKKADIGFHKEADGNFSIVSDSYANSDMPEFIAEVKRKYAQAKFCRKARTKGLKITARDRIVERNGKKYLYVRAEV